MKDKIKIILSWLKENWRPILFTPIIGIVIIYVFLKMDESPVLKDIFAVLGFIFLLDIIWKTLSEERQKKIEVEELEKIKKKYFDK